MVKPQDRPLPKNTDSSYAPVLVCRSKTTGLYVLYYLLDNPCVIYPGYQMEAIESCRSRAYRPISEVSSCHVILRTGGQVSEQNNLMCPKTDLKVILMNFCAVLGGSNRSNREKDKGYYRIPAIGSRSRLKKQALSVERRATCFARISVRISSSRY